MNGMTRSPSQGINFNPKLSVDGGLSLVEHNGSLYAAWPEGANYVYRIRVARYNPNDANPGWVSVDGATKNGLNFSGSKSAKEPQLVSFNGKLYAFWVEQGQLRARVYNDANNTWSWVDGGRSSGLNIDPTKDVRTLAAVAGVRSGTQDKLYLGFIENNASYVGQVRVKVYSEINGVKKWELADGGEGLNCDPSTGATEFFADLEAAANDTGVYFAWSEPAFPEIPSQGTPSPHQVRIVHSDGSTIWRSLDGDDPVSGLNLDATKNAYVRDLQTIGGKAYLMWAEDTSIRAAVGEWGGSGEFVWTQVDGGGTRGNVQVNEAAVGQDASFGVLGDQLFAFTIEGPLSGLRTGYVSAGIEPADAP